jgi:hypothetical protein
LIGADALTSGEVAQNDSEPSQLAENKTVVNKRYRRMTTDDASTLQLGEVV